MLVSLAVSASGAVRDTSDNAAKAWLAGVLTDMSAKAAAPCTAVLSSLVAVAILLLSCHDLRHTCASHLVMGTWTRRPWRLEEVQAMMGHSSSQLTQRYAHLAPTVLDEAARGVVPGWSQSKDSDERIPLFLRGGWDRDRTCDQRRVKAPLYR